MSEILKTMQGQTLAQAFRASALREMSQHATRSANSLRISAEGCDTVAEAKRYLSDADEFRQLAAYLNRMAEHAHPYTPQHAVLAPEDGGGPE
jgi:hypothetical protein